MNAATSVYGRGPRHDTSPAQFGEATSEFLARVAGEFWQSVRDLLDDWMSHVPPQEQPDLIGRLRSPENHHFNGALLELYLHESLIRSGYKIEFHPHLPRTKRRPDFLVHAEDASFYLEARSLSTGKDKLASSRRISAVYDALNTTPSPHFWLAIDVESEGGHPPATKGLRRQLVQWLDSLDPDTYGTEHRDLPTFHWEQEGWQIEFRAIPKPLDSRGPGTGTRPLAIFGGREATWADDTDGLKRALEDKGSAYGRFERGYVIAVGTSYFSSDDFGVKNTLYGPEQILIDPAKNEVVGVARGPGGYFHAGSGRWAHPHVSGVLVVNNLNAALVTRQVPTYWANPRASHEVSPAPAWDVTTLRDEQFERRPAALSHRELFQLPETWPPGERFPK